MPNLRSLPLCALAGAMLCTLGSAQSPASAVRILNKIDENHLVALKGNVNPLANAANDRGPVSAGQVMGDLTLVLSRSAGQQAAFDAFVEGQYDAGSPNFHQWLTPQQIGERYGPAQADIATISSWLGGQGFVVTAVSPDRMTISFRGTAGQVQSAFHTEIHTLSVKGVPHIANMTDPEIPEALSAVVIGVKGLHNFFPHPLHRTGNQVQLNRSNGGWQRLQDSPALSLAAGGVPVAAPAAQTAASLRPMYTYTPSGSSSVVQDVTPFDFATIYNILPLWQNTSMVIDGTGQKIAVIGTSDINASDVAAFKSAFGLPAGLTPVQAKGVNGIDPGVCSGSSGNCGLGDLEENSLDVEWSGAVAPGAQVVLVTSGYNDQTIPTNDPIFQSASYVINNVNTSGSPVNNARIMSISYGLCELAMGTAGNVAYRNLWQVAASAGIAVIVATGDAGSPACDQGGDAGGYPYEAQYGLAVNGLASTPFNTAVGGTDFNWCKPSYNSGGTFQGCASTDAAPYWNSTNTTGTQATAKGYVPETPWNDSCLNPVWSSYLASIAPLVGYSTPANPEAACNFVYNNWKAINAAQVNQPGGQQFVLAWSIDSVGAGGGASNCVVNDNTNSSSCSSSTSSTGASYGNLALVNNGWPKPSWQSSLTGSGDGVRNLPDVSFFSGDGSLNSATLICVASAGAGCTGTLSSSALEIGGTSVATPEMAGVMALINQGAGSPQGNPNSGLYKLAALQPSSGCSAESVTAGSASCYFNDVDQGTISMPCAVSTSTLEGGATYSSTGWNVNATTTAALASPNCAALNSGDKVGTLVSSGTTPGFNALAGFDLATGLGSLNVWNVVNGWTATSPTGATATVAVQPASSSVDSDTTLGVTVTVTGGSGTPTGTATLLAGSYVGSAALSSGAASFTIPAGTFTSAGSQPIKVTYNGDATYAAASNSANVTVNYVYFTMAAISNPAAISMGGSATATATVSTSNNYDGTVSFYCALTSASTSTNYPPTCSLSSSTLTLSSGKTSGSLTVTVNTTKLTAAASYPKLGNGKGWLGPGAGTVLALLVFLGIPARRRSWRAMLGVVVLMAALSTLSACGSGGGSSSTTTTTGTDSGTYKFGVWAIGDPALAAPPTQTFTVTVN